MKDYVRNGKNSTADVIVLDKGTMWTENKEYIVKNPNVLVYQNRKRSIAPEQITESIRKMYEVARQNPDKQFKVAYTNGLNETTLNGYTGAEMIKMFKDAGPIPSNVVFSKNWTDHWNDAQQLNDTNLVKLTGEISPSDITGFRDFYNGDINLLSVKLDEENNNLNIYINNLMDEEHTRIIDLKTPFNEHNRVERWIIAKYKNKSTPNKIVYISFANETYFVEFNDDTSKTIYKQYEDGDIKDVTKILLNKNEIIDAATNERNKRGASERALKNKKESSERAFRGGLTEEEIEMETMETIANMRASSKTLDPDSFDAKLNRWISSKNFTSEQKYAISRNVMQTASYLINQLLSNPEYVFDEIIDKTTISINSEIRKNILDKSVSKEYIIENLGFQTFFDIIKEYYFINKDLKSVKGKDKYNHYISLQLADIIDNFDAIVFCGRSTLTRLEKYKLNLYGKYLPTEQEIENIYDEESNWFEQLEESDNEAWQIDYDATSAIENISHDVINKLYTIPIRDSNNNILSEYFDMPMFEDGKSIAKIILDTCYAQPTFTKMIKKLEQKKDLYNWVEPVINYAKNIDGFQSMFFTSFRKDRINRTVLTLRYEENDKEHINPIFEVEELSYDFSDVDRNFNNYKSKFDIGFSSDIFKFNNDVVSVDKNAISYILPSIININKKRWQNSQRLSKEDVDSVYNILYQLGFEFDYNIVAFLSNNVNGFLPKIVNILKDLKNNFNVSKEEFNSEVDFNFEDLKEKELSFKKIFEEAAPFIDNEKEAMQYENGKSYYAFSNPTFLSDLVNKLQNLEGLSEEEYKRELKRYFNDDFLQKDGVFKNGILYDLINDATFRNKLKIATHINTESESYDKIEAKDTTPYLEIVTRLSYYFFKGRNKSGNQIKAESLYSTMAYYRCGVFSNKTQNSYLYLHRIPYYKLGKKYSELNENFRNQIGEHFYKIFSQEVDRIKDVISRAKNGSSVIQNRDIPKELLKKVDLNNLNKDFFRKVQKTGASFRYLKMFQFLLTNDFDSSQPIFASFQDALIRFINGDEMVLNSDLHDYFMQLLWDKYEIKEVVDKNGKVSTVSEKSFNGILDVYVREMEKYLKGVGVIGEKIKIDKKDENGEKIKKKLKNGKTGYEKIELEKSPVFELNMISKEKQMNLVKDFILNDFINQCYINQLVFNDLAFSENAGDAQKRAAGEIAPGKKLDTEAEFDVDGKKIKVTDGISRSIIVEDEKITSEAYDIIEQVFSEEIERVKARSKVDADELEIYFNLVKTRLKGYKKYKPADGQSWISITGAFKKLLMLGEAGRQIISAYKSIAIGNITKENLDILMQPFKPVIYGPRRIQSDGYFKNINVTTYIKDSEYCALLMDGLIRGGKKDSMLTAIVDVMEESAYDVKGDISSYNGHGIDNTTMKSAQKTGVMNAIDLSDNVVKKRMEDKSLSKSDAIKDIIKENIYIKDENGNLTKEYNKDFVVETSFDDWRKQQDIPSHFRGHEQQMGSQERALVPMDIEPDDIFDVNGVQMKGSDIQEECMELTASYIKMAVEDLKNQFGFNKQYRKNLITDIHKKYIESEDDDAKKTKNLISRLKKGVDRQQWDLKYAFGIDFASDDFKDWLNINFDIDNNDSRKRYILEKFSNPNSLGGIFSLIYTDDKSLSKDINDEDNPFEISEREQTWMLSNILKKQILDNDRYDTDLLKAVSLNDKGEFNIPLCEGMHAVRVQQLLNSIIKNNINKQYIPGGPIVQVSAYGLSKKLNIRWYKKNSDELLKTKEEWENDKENYNDYKTYVKENKGKLAYHEVIMSIPWGNDIAKLLTKEDGTLMTPQEGIDKGIITEDMLYSIGYRIPTENKSSIYPMKIVGFAPVRSGDVIILPDEIVTVTGSDFDIDKTYIMFKSFKFENGKLDKKAIGEFFQQITANVRKSSKNSFDNKKELEEFVESYKENIKHQYDSLFDILKNIHTKEDLDNVKVNSDFEKTFIDFLKINFEYFYIAPKNTEIKDLSTKEGINNRLLDLHFSILRDEKMQYLMMNPQGFQNLEKTINIVEICKSKNINLTVDEILKLNLDEAEEIVKNYELGIDYANFMSFKVQTQFVVKNMNALKLTGIFATHNVSHAFVQMANNKLPKDRKIRMFFSSELHLDGFVLPKTISQYTSEMLDKVPILDDIYDNKKLSYQSTILGSNVGASVDVAKKDALSGMNINPDTANVAALLERLGFDDMFVGLFLNQPIIYKVLDKFYLSRNKGNKSLKKTTEDKLFELYSRIGGRNITNGIKILEAFEYDYEYKKIEENRINNTHNTTHLLTTRNLALFLKQYNENEDGMPANDEGKIDIEKLCQQACVLKSFNALLEATDALSLLTDETKLNSIKSAVGPLILNNLEKIDKHNDFIKLFDDTDKPFSDDAKNIIQLSPLLNAFWEASYSDDSITSEIFKKHFIEYTESFKRAWNLFRETTSKRIDNKTRKKFIFDFMLYLLTNGNNPFFNQDYNHRINNIIHMPAILNEIKELLNYEGEPNMFTNNIFTTQNKIGFDELDTNFNGLDSSQSELIKADFSEMLNSDNDKIKSFTKKIILYFFQRSGFNYSPKTGTHMIPYDVKMETGYANAISNIFENEKRGRIIDYENFVKQFYMNNSDVNKVTPVILISEIKKDKKEDCTLDENKGILVVKKGAGWGNLQAKNGKSVIAFNSNGELFIKYNESEDGSVVEYHSVNPLGQKFNYLEYNANEEWYEIKSVINDLKNANWDGLTRKQRKELSKKAKKDDSNDGTITIFVKKETEKNKDKNEKKKPKQLEQQEDDGETPPPISSNDYYEPISDSSDFENKKTTEENIIEQYALYESISKKKISDEKRERIAEILLNKSGVFKNDTIDKNGNLIKSSEITFLKGISLDDYKNKISEKIDSYKNAIEQKKENNFKLIKPGMTIDEESLMKSIKNMENKIKTLNELKEILDSFC